ncbi:hypothetical protein RclHR1_18040004 [Rhizophagus clarus]|uniref:Kinase-like domain-containing protein n=1 Tax=Rhizophagus clarus TaxID=94130 RepID=A0A2Z6QN31_9GLOM|nr:hypothetical protein RclHR1_18040004 [Rhizophagus clarus]GES79970.1 kinase-like domain-containing protein [Rhizophagus clarus]
MLRHELINAKINHAYESTDDVKYNNIHTQHEFRLQFINDCEDLSPDEIKEAVKILQSIYDSDKVLFKSGEERICENCKQKCFATSYCEHCVRIYLKSNYNNWKSGNDDIDKLIRKCQSETLKPDMIVEWIPYEKLKNISYLTKGGFAEIYTANWIDGQYNEWDSGKKRLKRIGNQVVIIKKLENVKSANRSWFEEAESHLSICNKWMNIVQCFGLTQDRSGNYMLVMTKMDMDLEGYLKKHRGSLSWPKKFKVVINICSALHKIHVSEKVVHRDLHSGNVLYSQKEHYWYISDLGFCGSVDKPIRSLYGNLPYIAPEVIIGKKHTIKSDIYSIGMLMWEISSGQHPFCGYYHDFNLVLNIFNGMRPAIVPGTPSEYMELMKQCWDAIPENRPNIETLFHRIKEINKRYCEEHPSEAFQHDDRNDLNNTFLSPVTSNQNISSMFISKSKMHIFGNYLPEPKNISEEEQKVLYQEFCRCDDAYIPNLHPEEQDGLEIPDNIEEFWSPTV